jgi:hypothetical protein
LEIIGEVLATYITLELVGELLAITGATISIYGTLVNNLRLDHIGAMKAWRISNPILAIWAFGLLVGFWTGGLGAAFLLVMYLIFYLSNRYGLKKYHQKPL